MGVEPLHKATIPTLGPMLKPDKARALPRNGVSLMCREETRAQPWDITQPLTEPWPEFLVRRGERRPLPAPNGETPQPARRPAEICMRDTTATYTRIQVTAGRSTITAAGT